MDITHTAEIESAPIYEQMMTVGAFIMPYEADIVRALLESGGVSAFLMDYHTIYIKWFYAIPLGGVKVKVYRKDFEFAKEIVQQALIEGHNQTSESSEGPCPVCKSTRTAPVVLGRRWAVLSWLIIGVPLVWPWIRLRCAACGSTWRTE